MLVKGAPGSNEDHQYNLHEYLFHERARNWVSRRFVTCKPLPEPMLTCYQLETLKKIFQWNFVLNWEVLIPQNAFEHWNKDVLSIWRKFHPWLPWKVSKWQLSGQPRMKISPKWWHFCFRENTVCRMPTISFQPKCVSKAATVKTTLMFLNSLGHICGSFLPECLKVFPLTYWKRTWSPRYAWVSGRTSTNRYGLAELSQVRVTYIKVYITFIIHNLKNTLVHSLLRFRACEVGLKS